MENNFYQNETFTQPANQMPLPYYQEKPANPYNAMAITAFVCGILGLLCALSCCVTPFSFIFGIIGLVFAILSRKYNAGKMSGMAVAGMVCSIIALSLFVIWAMFLILDIVMNIVISNSILDEMQNSNYYY